VTLLALKLLLTPALIGGASFVARRWGPAVGGWLIALPLTSGPVILYLALDHGTAFAASTAEGSLGGAMAVGVFSLAYARLARSHRWPVAVTIGCVAFGTAALAVQPVFSLPFAALVGLVAIVLVVLVRLMPPGSPGTPRISLPWWDVPARMVTATVLVLAITAAAPLLGPHASGVLATFPVFASVVAVFTHDREGPGQAINVLRGLLLGVFGTCLFFVVLRLTLEALGVAFSFGLAIAAALFVQWFALRIVRESRSQA
jgi:hypothetical protein